jgi:pimeloyl-ACP methyl ester carboxylesterase
MVRTVELPEVIYLHGLGSSPLSAKARLVSGWCKELGLSLTAPVLSLPSFERLSVDAVVSHVASLVERVPVDRAVVLLGSSFGGFVAVHAFDRLSDIDRARVRGMMLMAPVFYPWHHTVGLLTPEIERVWRAQGFFPLIESASGDEVEVHYQFVDELRGYCSDAVSLSVPTLIVHGTRDETVSHEQSVEFAKKRNLPRVVLLDDDHQLLGQPERLRALFEEFIRRVG